MKILLLQETNWIERGLHQQHHLMDRMSLRGHVIHVIDYDLLWKTKNERPLFKRREYLGNQPKVFTNARVELIRPGIIQLPILDYFSIPFSHKMEIEKEFVNFKPDIIISFGILNAYIGAKLAKKHNIPHVYYLIDHLHTLLPLNIAKPIARFFEKETIRESDMIFVTNKGLEDYAVEMGAGIDRILVFPAGVDLEKFDEGSKERLDIRRRYGIEETDIALFFMGWLYDFSGLKELAIELLKSNIENIKLLIVGDGDLFDRLNSIKGDSKRIILTGKKSFDTIPGFVSASDICLLPAYSIPTMRNIVPIKIYEYMAAGKPVIATNLPGLLKEFGTTNGILYINRPEDAFKKALELIESGRIQEEGRKAKRFVEKQDWNTITDDFEAALETLI